MAEDRVAARRDWLAQRRKALGLTQEDLAGVLNVERSTVVRWERGQSAPLPWIRPKLARALKVTAGRLEELLTVNRTAPSVGTVPNVPRQLPAAVAGFTGRAAELQMLTQMLDQPAAGPPGTVVISAIGGTAGVGKTALAVHWAHQAADRFPDGQLYVNLSGYDPDQPMSAGDALAGFLRVLGVPGPDIPAVEDERAARYRSLLAGKKLLVVLDNASSAEQVRPLLPGSPGCVVVVTSRESLAGLVARHGAVRLELDLLPPAEAVGLLCALIGQRADDDPGAAAALAGLCCRLPLALRVAAELAAARPGMSLASLVAELAGQRRLDLLEAGGDPRTAVRAVFSWSYRHLDPAAARAFRRLGLHPGADLDPYAAAALTGTGLQEAHTVLDALARAYLIWPAGAGRYGMHDLLRAYARELADARDDGEEQDALARLFDHYLHTASIAIDVLYPAKGHRRPRIAPAATPAPPVTSTAAAQAWLDAERATLVAVTVYAAGHGWLAHATRLAATLWGYLEHGGHYPEAIIIHSQARAAAELAGDRAAQGTALNHLAGVYWQQGRHQQAADHLRQAMPLFEQAGDHARQSWVLHNLALIHHSMGQYRDAISLLRQAQDIDRETGAPLGNALTLNSLGICEARLGRYDLAARHFRQALTIAEDIGSRDTKGIALINLGTVALLQGLCRRAAIDLHRALALFRETGYQSGVAEALARIGDLRLRQGRPEEATRHLHEALALCRELGSPSCEADALNSLGEVLVATGQPDHARAEYAAALGLAAATGDKYQQARAYRGLGEACRADGNPDEARRQWEQAFALFTELGTPEADQVRGQLAAAQGGGHRQQETDVPVAGLGKPQD